MIKAYDLYTGADGHSHFQAGTVQEHLLTAVKHIDFKESPAGADYSWHTAPVAQFVITLSGTLEFTMHSGKTFVLHPGEVLIARDTTGSGHLWRLIDDQPWRRVYIPFDEQAQVNFLPDKEQQV
ncbi:cupin domain-containing protein [Mucilaginibacter sp.]